MGVVAVAAIPTNEGGEGVFLLQLPVTAPAELALRSHQEVLPFGGVGLVASGALPPFDRLMVGLGAKAFLQLPVAGETHIPFALLHQEVGFGGVGVVAHRAPAFGKGGVYAPAARFLLYVAVAVEAEVGHLLHQYQLLGETVSLVASSTGAGGPVRAAGLNLRLDVAVAIDAPLSLGRRREGREKEEGD